MNPRGRARRARRLFPLLRRLHRPPLVGPPPRPAPVLPRENDRGGDSERPELLTLFGGGLRKAPRLERDLVPLEIGGGRIALLADHSGGIHHPHLNALGHHWLLSSVVHLHRLAMTRARSSIEGPRPRAPAR